MRRRYQLFAWVLLPVLVAGGLFFWPLTAIQCQTRSQVAEGVTACSESVMAELNHFQGSSWWWLPVETTIKQQLQQQGFRLLSWHKVLPGTLVVDIAEPELLYRVQGTTMVTVSQQGTLFPMPETQEANNLPLVHWDSADLATQIILEPSRQVSAEWHGFLSTVVATALASKQPLRDISIQSAETALLTFGEPADQLHILIDRVEPAIQVQRAAVLYQQRNQLNLPEPRPIVDARYRLPLWRTAVPAAPVAKPTASAATQVASPSSSAE